MQKETAVLLCIALVVPACSGGSGLATPPVAVASPAAVAPHPLPTVASCLLLNTRVHANDCGAPEQATDNTGDTATQMGGMYAISGDGLGGFDSDLLMADFGSYSSLSYDAGGFLFYTQIPGYAPMSNACQEALQTLNMSFLGWVIGMFGTVVPALRLWKLTFAGGTAIGTAAGAGAAGLTATQQAVNIECSGQGAGQNPGGPLPSGYTPGN